MSIIWYIHYPREHQTYHTLTEKQGIEYLLTHTHTAL